MSSDSQRSLSTRTLHGMFWAYGSYVGGRVLVLVSTAILARLLTPEDFGVVALALIFTAFLDAIADLGISQALEWCYSGRVFDAQEALHGRLVSKVVNADVLLSEAHKLAVEIRDNTAPVSIALIRQMMWRGLGMDHPMEAHKVDSRGIYSRGQSGDVKEGVVAFLEKRPANFPNKVSTDMPRYFPWWDERKYS